MEAVFFAVGQIEMQIGMNQPLGFVAGRANTAGLVSRAGAKNGRGKPERKSGFTDAVLAFDQIGMTQTPTLYCRSERLLGSCISVKFLCHKSGCQSPADKQMPVDYALLFP